MTKKAKISFLIVVWSIVAIQMYVNYEQRIRLREEAVTAFSVEQDKVPEETIHGYGKFGDMELTDANKKKIIQPLIILIDVHPFLVLLIFLLNIDYMYKLLVHYEIVEHILSYIFLVFL